MKRIFTLFSVVSFLLILSGTAFTQNIISDKYTASFDACIGCSFQTGNAAFYDDGGKAGAVGEEYRVTTFTANPGFILSLYFTDIDLPIGAKINVYTGTTVNAGNLVKTFYQIEKTRNIEGESLTIEYIPAPNPVAARGWVAHIDELVSSVDNTASRVSSPPESDCPYAIPLCQNNTAIALAGQYSGLGDIYDDEGSCYSGTGNGGSVWYSFSPQTSGPVDFTINPIGSTDYDFVLFDITNGCQDGKRNELACNYSLYTGTTGLSSTSCNENYGDCSSNNCSNQSKSASCNRFNNRVNVTVGRQYAICINFYSGSNDGFLLEFKKESSSVPITDVIPPAIVNAFSTNCPNATNFRLLTSEWVTCASIQNTDFTIAGHTFSIVNTNCVNGRTNTVDITISPALTVGTYTVNAKNIMDVCGNNMNSDFNIVIGANPVATISNPVLVCKSPGLYGSFNYSPETQTLTAGGGTSYLWSEGQTGPTAVFSATSTKTVSVTVISGSCASIASKTINVESATVNLGPNQLYCGTPITFTALPSLPGSTYTFYKNPPQPPTPPPSNGTQLQTGTSNTLTVSPAGFTIYRVVIKTPSGCTAYDEAVVTVNPPANASFIVPGTNYCLGANPFVLTASPEGGTFTGTGMSNDTFYPAKAGIGLHAITYSVTTPCGTFSATRNIRVVSGTLPVVDLKPAYCISDPDDELDATPRCGKFFGTGITQAGFCLGSSWSTAPVFSPSTAGIGSHAITYSNVGCANTFNVLVLGPGGAPLISGIGGPYCTSSPPITLRGNPAFGTFSGPGVTDSVFNPATAGVGTHTISYTVFACGSVLTNTAQIQVISGSASASISYTSSTFCTNNSTPQNVTRTGSAGGIYISTPAGLSINSSTGAITPSLSSPGGYIVTYTIASGGGCAAFSTTTPVTISAPPSPVFTSSNSAMCVNDTRTLAATPGGGTLSVLSGPGTVAGTTLTATGSGTIQLQYSVTVAGCTGTTTQSITSNACVCASPPTVSLSSNSGSTCETTAVTVNGNTFGGSATSVTVTENGAGTVSPASANSSPFSFTYTPAPGDGGNIVTITVTTDNPSGSPCTPAVATYALTVNAPPTPAFTSSNAAMCVNDTRTLAATPTGGTFTILSGPGTIAGNILTATGAGTIQLQYSVTVAGCTGTTTQSIMVNPIPTPAFTSSNAAMCVNDTRTLAATPTGGTFSVLSGPGTVAGTTLTATGAGTIQLQYSVTVAGCTGTTTQSITVNPIPTPVFTSSNTAMCINDTRTLAATPTGGTFTVLSGPGTVAGTTLTATGAGTIQLQYSVTVAGCTGTTTQSITVNPIPTPVFTSSNAAMCVNDTRTLAATPTGGTFSVLSGPGTVAGTTLTATGAGAIQLQYSVTVAGCTGTTTQSITSNACVCASPPTVSLSSNSGSTCETTAVTVNGNTFGGSATNITVTEDGVGTVSPASANSSPFSFTYTPAPGDGGNIVTITVTTDNPSGSPCIPAVATYALTVNASPVPVFTSSNAAMCVNDTRTLAATPTGGTFSVLSGPGTITGTTLTATGAGTIQLQYSVTVAGCTGTTTQSITVNPIPTPVFTSSNAVMCVNDTRTLAATPAGGTFSVLSGPGTVAGTTLTATGAGTIQLQYSVTVAGCTGTTTQSITVNPIPTPAFTSSNAAMCVYDTRTLAATATGGAFSVLSGPGTVAGTTLTATGAGTIQLQYSVTVAGCTGTTTQSITVNPIPAPAFTSSNAAMCVNDTRTLVATPTGGTFTILSGSGTIAGTALTATGAGTIQLQYSVTVAGCTGTTTQSITVNPIPTPVFTSSNGAMCINDTRTLAATPNGGTFSVLSGPGTIAGTTLSATGAGMVQVEYSISVAGCTATTTQSIPVNSILIPTITSSNAVMCVNDTRTLAATPSGGTFTVLSGPGTIAGTTLTATGVGTIQIEYIPVSGCPGTTTQSIIVNPIPTPAFTSSNAAMCVNDTRTLAATPTGGTFSVLSGPGTVAGTTLTATGAGTIQLQYSVTVAGCTGTTTQSITVNPIPAPAFTSSNAAMCINDTRTLAATPTGGTFSVLSGPGTIAGTTLTATGSGTIQIQYSVTVAGCPGTTTQSITVNPIPTPVFTSSNAAMCVNDTRTLVATPTGGTFTILSGSGTIAGTTLTATGAGTIQLQYSVTVAGCPGMTTQSITVNPIPTPVFTSSNGAMCVNDTRTLAVTPTGGTFSVLSGPGTIAGTTLTATGAGTIQLQYSVTVAGCTGTTTQSITVNPIPTPVFTSSNAAMCVNDTRTLAATPTGGTFTILSGLGTIAGTTLTTTGSATIQLQYSVTVAGCTGTTTQSITVNPIPTPVFTSSNAAMCVNDTRTLAATPTGGTFTILSGSGTVAGTTLTATGAGTIQLQYIVTVAGCPGTTTQTVVTIPNKTTNISRTICQGSSVTVGSQTFTLGGNYTVLLQTSTGCDSTVNLSLTVNPTIVPGVSIRSNTNDICKGAGITFTATPAPAGLSAAYQWQVNGVNAGTNSPQFTSSALNNGDVVRVILTTTTSCATPTTVNSNDITAIVNTVNYTKPAVSYCEQDSLSVDLQISTAPNANYAVIWTNGTTVTTDSTSLYTVKNTVSGNIPFEIKYGNNCSKRDVLNVQVKPIPLINAVVDKPSVKYQEEVQLDVITSATLSYSWSPAGMVSDSVARDPKAVITASTVFEVNVRDNDNCTNKDTVFVELIDECQERFIYVPNAFSPNRDGVNDCFGIMSPPQLSDFRLLVFNRWGEKVFETEDVNGCWDGTYKGAEAMTDSYVYLISFKCYNGVALSRKGAVTIVK